MTGPLDAITAIHNAFRKDVEGIDAAALEAARGADGRETEIGRYRLMNEVLVRHAEGEEIAIFPAVEEVAPSVAEAYERDHRALDEAYRALDLAVTSGDAVATARATAALRFHLDVHLAKEDAHLYRIVRQRVPGGEQAKAVGVMAAQVPPDRQPDLIAWLFPLIGDDDRENMLRIQQAVLPPDVFAGVVQLVRKAVGDDWAGLVQRMPDIAS